MGTSWGHLGASWGFLGASGAGGSDFRFASPLLGPSRGHLRAFFSHIGRVLRRLRVVLGTFVTLSGPSCGVSGAALRASWAVFGSEWFRLQTLRFTAVALSMRSTALQVAADRAIRRLDACHAPLAERLLRHLACSCLMQGPSPKRHLHPRVQGPSPRLHLHPSAAVRCTSRQRSAYSYRAPSHSPGVALHSGSGGWRWRVRLPAQETPARCAPA